MVLLVMARGNRKDGDAAAPCRHNRARSIRMRLLCDVGVQRCQLCSSAVRGAAVVCWQGQRSAAQLSKARGGVAQQTGSTQKGFQEAQPASPPVWMSSSCSV